MFSPFYIMGYRKIDLENMVEHIKGENLIQWKNVEYIIGII